MPAEILINSAPSPPGSRDLVPLGERAGRFVIPAGQANPQRRAEFSEFAFHLHPLACSSYVHIHRWAVHRNIVMQFAAL